MKEFKKSFSMLYAFFAPEGSHILCGQEGELWRGFYEDYLLPLTITGVDDVLTEARIQKHT